MYLVIIAIFIIIIGAILLCRQNDKFLDAQEALFRYELTKTQIMLQMEKRKAK